MPKFICLALSLICCLVVQTLALAAGEKPEETTSESNAKLATTTLVGVPASDTSAQHQGRSRVKHNIFRRAIGKLTFSPVTAAFETIEGNSFGLVQPLKGMEEGLKELKLPLADVKQELGALSEPIDGLKSRIENLHSPLEEIKKSTGQLKEPLTAVNSNLDRLRQPIEQLQEPISQLNEPLADLK